MKTRNYLLVMPILVAALQSCQKDTETNSAKHANLIVGKWMSYQKHTRVYNNDDNTLLKDTVIIYRDGNGTNSSWYETYKSDGAAYVTGKPYTVAGTKRADTTAFMSYSIEGSHLTLKPNGGGTQTKPILDISATDMELESTYAGLPPIGWGLDVETTYKFTDEVFYKKQ